MTATGKLGIRGLSERVPGMSDGAGLERADVFGEIAEAQVDDVLRLAEFMDFSRGSQTGM